VTEAVAAPRRRRRLEYRRRCPGRPWLKVLWFDICECFCRVTLKLLYRFRIEGEPRVPLDGPCLFVSNHQSFLDPIVNGCAVVDRQLTAIARQSLFKFPPLAWLMRSFGAIELRDEAGDVGAFRAAIEELRAGRSVLIYPEGSRSQDGMVQEFREGVALLIRRAKVPVIPMGIEGAHDAWPRGRRFPRPFGRIEVEVGEPIPPEALPRDSAEMLDHLRRTIESLVQRRGEAMRRSGWRPHRPTQVERSGA